MLDDATEEGSCPCGVRGGGGGDDEENDIHVVEESPEMDIDERTTRRRITYQKGRITKLYKQLSKWLDEDQAAVHSVSALEDHIVKAKKASDDLGLVFDDFTTLPTVTEEEYKKMEDEVQGYFVKNDETVASAQARIDQLNAARTRSNDTAAVNTFAGALRHTTAKLPQLSIKKFGGEYGDWGRFQSQFRPAVHERDTLTDADKFNYLMFYLEGEARSKVAGMIESADSYQEAYALLEERYGHKRLTVSRVITMIANRPKIKHDRDLGTLVDDLRAKYRLLKTLSPEFEAQGASILFLSLFQAKLSDEIREKWERKVMDEEQKKGHDPSDFALVLNLDDFFRFLDVIVMSREALRGKSDKSDKEKSDQANVAVAGGGKGANGSGGNKGKNSGAGGNAGGAKGGNPAKSGNTAKNSNNTGKGGNNAAAGGNQAGQSGGAPAPTCLFCKAHNHRTPDCPSIEEFNWNQRWKSIKRRVCYRCLLPRNKDGHPGTGCTLEGMCPVEGCNRFHHQFLHNYEEGGQA